MTPSKERFPKGDEMEDDDFIPNIEHEDIVFEEAEKLEQKINDYFERSNEQHWEERVANE